MTPDVNVNPANPERPVNVRVLVEELRAEVSRKRASGELPAELFLKGDPDSLDPEARDDLDANLQRANATSLLARRQSFAQGGNAAGWIKRLVQRLILFHTDFLVDQVEKHNTAVVRVLNRYKTMLDDAGRRLAQGDDVASKLGERLADLESDRVLERLEAIERALKERGTGR